MRARTVKEKVPASLANDVRWVSCAEVARMVGVSRQAISDRCRRGTLEFQRDFFNQRAVLVRPADAVKEFAAGRPVLRPFADKEIYLVHNPDAAAVLFARSDSIYKSMGITEVWDAERDAMQFSGSIPVVAHPPCRAWGRVRGLAKPRPGEKDCARRALAVVRGNGGVLEHPKGSTLWREYFLPLPGMFPDQFGGYTIEVDQFDFGHVAHKATWLYIVGVKPENLPPLPKPVKGMQAARSIMGDVAGTQGCTKYMREYTPPKLAAWLYEVAALAGLRGKGINSCSSDKCHVK